MSQPIAVMNWSSELNWFLNKLVVALLSRWLYRMMILSRRFPDGFPFILYFSSHTITFFRPALDSEPIRKWYNMFLSCEARVGVLMYNSSSFSTSSRSNSKWFVSRFVYFVVVIGSSGMFIIPTASPFHWNFVARSLSVLRNWWRSLGTQSKGSSFNLDVPFLCSFMLLDFAKLITPYTACAGFNANGIIGGLTGWVAIIVPQSIADAESS